MLQIRLSKGGSTGDGGGGGTGTDARPSLPSVTVTVACPDHLVISDLPVAKSLGTTPSSNAANIVVKSVGRRARRHLGERVHFCVCCDFPIAIYGRLIPCEHAFCLTCARSDSSCYLCDERIQKIQTIKMMEGIVICAAPHCLKSFLKRSEFESHVHEVHADLLQPEIDREGANETDPVNITRPSTDSLANKSAPPESSTAHALSRPGFSSNTSSQLQDRDDRVRRHQSRESTPMRPPLQQMPVPVPFHNHQLQQSAESLLDNNQRSQGIWFQNSHASEYLNAQQNRKDSDQLLPDKHTEVPSESPFPDFPQSLPFQLPSYSVQMPFPVPVVINPVMTSSSQFSYATLPVDGCQAYYNTPFEMQRAETMQEQGQDQFSVARFLPPAGAASFPDNTRQWNTAGFVNMQVQGNPEGAPLHLAVTLPPPPPLPPPFMSQQHRRGSFSGSGEVR